MIKYILAGVILISFTFATTACNSDKSIIADGARVEKLADGFAFTEGPAADAKGNVYFTDQPNNRILKWSTDGKLTVFMEDAGRSNGMYFDRAGNLLACADMENEIWSIAPDGSHTVLLTDYKGTKMNGPNDLWAHPGGAIYFTDPLYKRDYWTRNPEMQIDGEHVYRLDTATGNVTRIADDIKKPNGIIGTRDGKYLYVADIGDRKTYRYDIQPDGSLSNKQLAAPMGSDGITLDEKGNLYITGKGVTVFNPAGEEIEHIDVDAPWTANVTFGGRDGKTLFITASDALYSIQMNVKGD